MTEVGSRKSELARQRAAGTKLMYKKVMFLALVSLLLAPCFPTEAQQVRVSKLGWLAVRPRSSSSSFGLLDRELRALGYFEGKNIIIEYRSADLKIERLPALAEELVRLKVDVIVAPSTDETL